jgi:sugar/nucleoside kinase (ribokinase family)
VSGVVAVVGTVNRDRIVPADGAPHESLGGILYNVMAMAALLEGTGWRVRAVGRLGAEDRRAAERMLAGLPAADPGGLVDDPAGTNLSELRYRADGSRVERVEPRVAPLSEADLRGVEQADAVLVNMISGRDVARETLSAVRARSRGLFLLDVQALARTLDTPRRPRAVPDWGKWCALFDVVRGNEEEIASFPGGPPDAEEGARRILAAGAGEVLVTRGEAGSWRLARGADGPVREEVPAWPSPAAVDPTGCGDVYLAGVCAARVLGLAPGSAPWLGAWAAAQVAATSGPEALEGLRGGLGRAAREVPRLGAA